MNAGYNELHASLWLNIARDHPILRGNVDFIVTHPQLDAFGGLKYKGIESHFNAICLHVNNIHD